MQYRFIKFDRQKTGNSASAGTAVHRIIPDGGARRKNFCEMLQKAQGILDGLPSIFGKYHGNFWRDAPSEQPRVNDAVLP